MKKKGFFNCPYKWYDRLLGLEYCDKMGVWCFGFKDCPFKGEFTIK